MVAYADRFLDPLVDRPLADATALGDADLAGIEAADDLLDGVAHLRAVDRVERGAPFPGEVDEALQWMAHEACEL